MSNLILTALTPHPPIMIEEVGQDEVKKVQNSIDAMNKLGKKIVALDPDTIILVTPHSLYHPNKFSIYIDRILEGDLSMFRAPSVKLSFENNIEFIEKLAEHYEYNPIRSVKLDHGTVVPMYFIKKAGFKGKLVVINYCALEKQDHINFGKLLKKIIDESNNEKFVFIASGDLSHKLKPSAPAGYHPNAFMFDEKIKSAIEHGDYDFIKSMPFDMRDCAGECCYNSLMVAIGLLDMKPVENSVYSYEGPFGVGYMVATL